MKSTTSLWVYTEKDRRHFSAAYVSHYAPEFDAWLAEGADGKKYFGEIGQSPAPSRPGSPTQDPQCTFRPELNPRSRQLAERKTRRLVEQERNALGAAFRQGQHVIAALQQQHQVERANHLADQRALQSQGASLVDHLKHKLECEICQIETQIHQNRELAQHEAAQAELIQAYASADEKHRDPATRFDVLEEQRQANLNWAKEMKQNQELSKLQAAPTISQRSRKLAAAGKERFGKPCPHAAETTHSFAPTISKTSKDLASKSRQRRAAAASDRSSESSGSSDGTPGYTKSTVSSRGSKTKAEEHSFKPKINKLKGTMAEKVAATRASRPWNKK